jgi:hypothetical protein
MNPSTHVQEVKMIFSVQLAFLGGRGPCHPLLTLSTPSTRVTSPPPGLALHPLTNKSSERYSVVISHIAPCLSLLKNRKLWTIVVRRTPWPNLDPVFTKTSPNRTFQWLKRAFWACFRENGVYKFGHWTIFSGSVCGSKVAMKLLPTELIICVFGIRLFCVHSCIKAIYKRATSCKWDAIKANPKPFVGSFYTGKQMRQRWS